MWLRGRDGDVTAELGGASERRGRTCGRGGSSRRRRLHSVVAREGARGGEKLGERMRGVQGVAWPSPWRRKGVGEAATAKQEVAGALRARATPRLCLLAEEEEDKGGEEVGWAGQMELGQLWWAARVRPGNFLLCFI